MLSLEINVNILKGMIMCVLLLFAAAFFWELRVCGNHASGRLCKHHWQLERYIVRSTDPSVFTTRVLLGNETKLGQ
jgi:hypothetical protein